MSEEITSFGEILVYLIGGVIFIIGGLVTAWIIRPKRPNEEKLATYESGEEPLGGAWGQVNIRFYVVALIFLLFEVEIVFLFPWATVFGRKELIDATDGLWGWMALTEMFVFVFVLALGLAYAWRKGYLEWDKPEIKPSKFKGVVPNEKYNAINQKYSKPISENQQ
ncbi:MAG: NADH-quinone oxidoreductase subunit A [Cyclobacteriaceae bacterium]|nr:NADH-quinone oxidoreductase subunit A [Cyclobacteriaceae bacterium]